MYYSRLQVICTPDFSEILMAEIAETGFDTFMETENGFEAFAEQNQYDKQKLQEIKEKYTPVTAVVFYIDRVEKKNWNEEWEKSYEPIIVDDTIIIRAHFHKPERKYPYEIIITPKMSFGTGHHQTTHLMLKAQLNIDHKNKLVMDAGTGTAVLAIMASKLGARKVEAFDIDSWSVENGNENAEVNQCANINIRQGKISEFTFSESFDIMLANINKNILLEEMHEYAACLKPGGKLLLSGFYEKDIPELLHEAQRYDLRKEGFDTRDEWACLLLEKIIH
ncbi:MAG TPA: 50S ribosomal protein L11 methyltransferase [Cyclobacteriaceae bacterium]|nr:50S ribosomal protein L11 methyltransferase [Cyclobacteriaceae bacterium]HRJ80362.1 50S ribosomal protein L11 methyltransferase [Cyclobacteriaceae bacterium]